MANTSRSPDPPETPQPARPSAVPRFILPLALVAVIAIGVLLWRYSPLNQLLDPQNLKQILDDVRGSPYSVPAVVGFFVLLSVLGCPILVLTAGTSMTFGPWFGLLYSLIATMISALLTFGLGSYFGSPILGKFGEGRLARLNRALGRYGLVTAIVIRIAPIAPFPILNLIAGASHMRVLPFSLGTLIGVLPAVAAISGFGATLEQALTAPSLKTLWLPAVLALGWLMVVFLMHRFLRSRVKLPVSGKR